LVEIFDPFCNDLELVRFDSGDYADLDAKIQDFNPDIIGFGGIASSYGLTKKLSGYLHQHYPQVFQVAGGPLSSLYQLMLEKTPINLVFHGETERTLPIFMEKFGIGESWKDIGGISYKADGKIQRTSLAPQIEDIDEVPLPSNHLVDLKQYYKYIFDVIEGFAADNMGSSTGSVFSEKLPPTVRLFPSLPREAAPTNAVSATVT
jgi:radical SAM superfamily enzyme YgiQ (UPF0313 family)